MMDGLFDSSRELRKTTEHFCPLLAKGPSDVSGFILVYTNIRVRVAGKKNIYQ